MNSSNEATAEILSPSSSETLEDRKQRSREAIPVLPGQGLSPDNLAGYITMAQGLCKPDNLFLKPEIRSNLAVTICLMDIAARSNMSFPLLTQKAYVIKGVLCFEAQLIYAMAKPHLDGGLKGTYSGEGDNLKLMIRGKLKGDPDTYEHESPPLKQVHPGHTVKIIDGKSVQVVKGSQLWDRKPSMQLWYDTTRDWIRKHCPEAIFGLYTREEIEESDIEPNVITMPSLSQRLNKSPRPETGEGFRPDFVRSEVARAQQPVNSITPDDVTEQASLPDEAVTAAVDLAVDTINAAMESKPKRKGRPVGSKNGSKRAPKEPEPEVTPSWERAVMPHAQAAQEEPESNTDISEQPPSPAPEAPPQMSFLASDEVPPLSAETLAYIEETKIWIANATDAREAEARWNSEVETRTRLLVPIAKRSELKGLLEDRMEELRSDPWEPPVRQL
jgi:hypothetical protein